MNTTPLLTKLRRNAFNHPDGPILIPGGEAGREFQLMRRRLMLEAQRSGDGYLARKIGESRTLRQAFQRIRLGGVLPVAGAGSEDLYVVTSGSSAVSTSAKVALQLATGSTVDNAWLGWDFSQNGALNATTAATELDFQTTTTASSGGATATVRKLDSNEALAASSTARANDTTNGSSPATFFSFYIPVVSGMSYQFPLGREFSMTNSAFAGLLVTGATGVSASYLANVYFAE